MTTPVTQEPTRKAFHFPTSPSGQAVNDAEPIVAPEQSAAQTPTVVRKAAKSKRAAVKKVEPAAVGKPAKPSRVATAEAVPAGKKVAGAKAAASVETAPAVKKEAKAKASAAAPTLKKEAKPKRSAVKKAASATVGKTAKAEGAASTEAAPAVKKEASAKRSAASKTTPASVPEAKKAKPAKKAKVVRDSFTMPKSDYERIASLKQRCLDAGVSVKKSELLRAGLMMLESAAPQRLLAAVSALEAVKTGRPARD
jgi:hypothetical protein